MNRKKDPDRPNFRPNRPRKAKYKGNQHSNNDNGAEGSSASAKKLKTSSADDVPVSFTHFYRIIEFVSVFNALAEMVICKQCKQKVKFGESGQRGLGFKVSVQCLCGLSHINSGPLVNSGYEINRRIIFVMRMLGLGQQGINIFCGLMDLGVGLSKSCYECASKHILKGVQCVWSDTQKKAAREEQDKMEQNGLDRNILKVSGDGSWKKRGFSSLYGVTTLIGNLTGKVIDFVVKSAYCNACTYWKNKTNTEEYQQFLEEHLPQCNRNHDGPAGAMEVKSMLEMFSRSEELVGVKYGTYIGDGDTKTFKALVESKPYGDELKVTKIECVGHVQKRMGTRLRNIKKKEKLGGRGKLTDNLIKKLTTYYGLAIRRNSTSVEDMKNAIMGTFLHLTSTDKEPHHEHCPPGENSWCKFQAAQATNSTYEHPEPLHPDVAKHILPIYKDLSRLDLLERCFGGHTQNSNESFNATVWRLIPKHLHCGTSIMSTACNLAAGTFNEGYNFILRAMQQVDIIVGTGCKSFCDTSQLHRINRRSRSASRSATSEPEVGSPKDFDEEEEIFYGPGIAD